MRQRANICVCTQTNPVLETFLYIIVIVPESSVITYRTLSRIMQLAKLSTRNGIDCVTICMQDLRWTILVVQNKSRKS